MELRMRYPIGIQDFRDLRERGCVYVDKTGIIYRLVRTYKHIFLGRPRRFGKSLLSSTLKYYFQGQRELFTGLALERLEKEWKSYPVLHLDLSILKNRPVEEIRTALNYLLQPYEKIYAAPGNTADAPGLRLEALIRQAHSQTGEKVVVILDEYDAPLLDVLHNQQQIEAVRTMMQEFYAPLKSCDADLHFVFITGITKFSQLSIFSVINNLTNISMQPEFSAICGITEEELYRNFATDIEMLAQENECSVEEMKTELKNQYDGYHFSEKSADLYNPFSLLKAFAQKKLGAYWFDSGTPTYLIRQLKRFNTDITALDTFGADATDFDQPTEAMTNAIPLLYQSGYLTIKGYDKKWNRYTLGIPNNEVRVGLASNLLPLYTTASNLENGNFILRFCQAVEKEDLNAAFILLRAYMASIPYPEGGKDILSDMFKCEYYYETIIYLLFSFMNRYVQTQVKSCRGRADMVMHTTKAIYVFEIKINKPAKEALAQIDDRGYLIPYTADTRKLVKIGLSFNTEKRTIEEWIIA